MEKRHIDKLGVDTSLLGFGCMRFPTVDGKIDEKLSTEMLDMAYDAGVNYYDTAYPYHDKESELFVGKYLDSKPRESYYLATKLPVWEIHKLDDAKAMFAKQLERVHKDYIDFYLLHALDIERFRQMRDLGVIEYCEELKKQGKIRFFGFSFHDSYEAFEEIATYRDWDFCQIQYNYMDVNEQAGDKGYALTEKLGIPLVIMEPVKGGSLAKLPQDIMELLVDKNASPASYALRFVASHPNVKVVLSGMSQPEQVQNNLDTFINFKPLSEEEEQSIVRIREAMNAKVRNGCTGCRYCMPCPAGVDIPGNFKIWNEYNIYDNKGALSWQWNESKGEKATADYCRKCGLCETKCPQKINIRRDLATLEKEITDLLEI